MQVKNIDFQKLLSIRFLFVSPNSIIVELGQVEGIDFYLFVERLWMQLRSTLFFIHKNDFIRAPASDLGPRNNRNLRTISGSAKIYWFL